MTRSDVDEPLLLSVQEAELEMVVHVMHLVGGHDVTGVRVAGALDSLHPDELHRPRAQEPVDLRRSGLLSREPGPVLGRPGRRDRSLARWSGSGGAPERGLDLFGSRPLLPARVVGACSVIWVAQSPGAAPPGTGNQGERSSAPPIAASATRRTETEDGNANPWLIPLQDTEPPRGRGAVLPAPGAR